MRSKLIWLLALSCLTCCAQAQAPLQTQEEKVLNIYNWSDYIANDTISNFEKEFGIKVNYDVYDTNEVLNAKLLAGRTGYDIVVPSDNFAQFQIQRGLLRKLDKSKLPNLVNLDTQIQSALSKLDPGNNYLVNWLWGYTTVGINTQKVRNALGGLPIPANSWELLFNPKYAEKLVSCGLSLMDAGSAVLPAALLYIGKNPYSPENSDYKEAGKMLAKIRPFVRVFSSSSYINDLANGELCVVMGYSGDINIARERARRANNGNEIEALIPSTSAMLFFDSMAIPADAPHPNNALLFMNYILRPEVDASLTNKVFYANPNSLSMRYVNQDIANNRTVFLSTEDRQRMTAPVPITDAVRRNQTRTFAGFKAKL